ncbi:GPW/gp25 family protein [Cupriavidus basilensis]|uniref:Phage baseplate assembly protein n=1 Tax=Cupriavidus basilensis TaxID=68895 RepID=A0A0C4YEA8_9BURK|nr:GPW/gp25 family protein [Cupriavidus basilensis]AJG19121.1 Phage baseplate assembly protein [Cupriavidus basilensis]
MTTYLGMHAIAGTAIGDRDHIMQSVRDILTTPIGTRVMRRNYGSLLPELIDQPLHGATLLRAMSASVAALVRWEPRIRVQRVSFEVSAQGSLYIDIDAPRVDGPRLEAGAYRVLLREANA